MAQTEQKNQNVKKQFEELQSLLERAMALQTSMVLFEWDDETLAPKGAAEHTARVIGSLSEQYQEILASMRFKELLDVCLKAEKENAGVFDEVQSAILREAAEEQERLSCIPPEEYRAYAELTARATGIWTRAREKNDFASFAPVLKEIISYQKKFAAYRAKPGQKLAFVGSTGAGKTTITNLINRFYDIQEGKIRYDGINITKIKKDDLRRSLGIVLQDTHLFTGTIIDNIRYGKLDATDEEVYAAARLAHADQFIQMLPNGYQTMLSGDGEELSQGQRQLLSIARAAVANPPVLILDEATSSIDTRTESIVQKGMDNLMKGRTVFVIAHRLSTIRNSDAIIVLDHGKIIERGDHEDLIKMKGTYYQLYTGKLELS